MNLRSMMGAVWLAVFAAACSGSDAPPTTAVAADSADQVSFNMVHYITIDGIRRVVLEADTAFFYQKTQSVEMLGLKVDFYTQNGAHSSTITSRKGTYNWREQSMEARGDVVAVTPDGRRLTTDTLRYHRDRNEISGPSAFKFCGPDQQLEGDAFTSDPDFRRVETTRPRRGQIGDVACR